MKRFDDLEHSPVLGGWTSEFQKPASTRRHFFMGVKLEAAKESQRKQHHLYVSESTRNSETARFEISLSFKTFLASELKISGRLLPTVNLKLKYAKSLQSSHGRKTRPKQSVF